MTGIYKNLPGSSSQHHLQLLSRLQLPPNDLSSPLPQPISVHLLPGGDWLVAVTALNAGDSGRPDSTGVSLWDLRDISTPRCAVDLYEEGWSCPSTATEFDKELGIARLLFGCSSTPNSTEPQNILKAYEIPLGSQPTKPEAYQVSVPRHPSQGQDTDITDMALSGDILSCIVRDTSQLGAFFDNPDAQLKPLVPPAGLEQVYLIHRPTNTTRWLHPRHISSLNSVHVLFDDNNLYLLGRTPTTYILHRYHFSPNMLIECPDDIDLDLGEPLVEYESPPLPDPGIPWGSWDSQSVHLEPSSHLSVLMLRSWYGEGQYLRFPLPSWGHLDAPSTPTPTPIVVRLEPNTHLPSNAHLSPRWLGRDQAMIFSDDDDDLDKNLLVRLSFPDPDFEDVPSDRSISAADMRAAGHVLREDVLTVESPLAKETNSLTRARALSVDEESGRICFLLMNGEGFILSST